ncbi:MAG: PilZ domain-containing protein [Caulobacterales bacterium]|nr:PilZ domain-containing protein [Caulobacterales bacterium]
MTSAFASKSVDRRRVGRQRALLAGKLANEDATSTVDCVIRNISADGAMIETTTPQLIPNQLHLVQIKEGVAWDAEVIWRRGNRIGLSLGDRHDLRESTEKQLRALRAIWGQMALR